MRMRKKLVDLNNALDITRCNTMGTKRNPNENALHLPLCGGCSSYDRTNACQLQLYYRVKQKTVIT